VLTVATDLEMTRYIGQDAIGNGDVMLTVFVCGQTEVTTGLARSLIAELLERPCQFRSGNIS